LVITTGASGAWGTVSAASFTPRKPMCMPRPCNMSAVHAPC
jgi:hypothetical protein